MATTVACIWRATTVWPPGTWLAGWQLGRAATGEAQFASILFHLRWPSSRRAALQTAACVPLPCRLSPALFTTAAMSPGHPEKDMQFKNSPLMQTSLRSRNVIRLLNTWGIKGRLLIGSCRGGTLQLVGSDLFLATTERHHPFCRCLFITQSTT